MRIYKDKKVQYIDNQLIETRCDLCGLVARFGNYESSTYEVNETEIEVTVRQKDGSSFPEGGDGTEYIVDMCPECFKKKLIPWLESQGSTSNRQEWDW